MAVLQILTTKPHEVRHLIEELEKLRVKVLLNMDPHPDFEGKTLLFKFPYILDKLAISSLGGYGYIANFHNGLLPYYRGLHCPSWAIEQGETTLGATLHLVNHRIDDGEIINFVAFELADYQDINTFQNKIREIELEWLPMEIRNWINGDFELTPNTGGQIFPKRKDDNFINSSMSIASIINLIRAVNPPYGPGVIINSQEFTCFRFGLKLSLESKSFFENIESFEVDFQANDGSLKLTGFKL